MNYKYEVETRGHIWKTNDYDGSVDIFGFEAGKYHNGPICTVCGYGFCHHCQDLPSIECPGNDDEQTGPDFDDANIIWAL